MGSVNLETWERFYDRVVQRGSDWPRNLWFAAVEDGLRAALPAQSRLLVQYRQDVAALRELEREGLGSYRDSTRMAQLEAEIMHLIDIADQSIRDDSAELGEPPKSALPPPSGSHWRTGFWLGALTLGVVMSCGALLGATYYQQLRMSERMELDLAALQQRLLKQAADERAALEVRIRSADRVKANLTAFQAELRANVDEFNKLMSAGLRSVTALGDSPIADLERRLLAQQGDVAEALKALRERSATLKRQLDQVAEGLSVLAQRLPDLDSGVHRLAERLEATRAGFEQVESQVATIQAQAPELALWLEGERQALTQDLAGRRQTMGELAAEITTLQGALDNSRSQLVTLQAWLEQSLARADPSGHAPPVPGQQVIEIDGRIVQDAMQEQIDALLAELAGKAELAARRSEEMMKQAEADAAQRLDTVAGQAIDGLSRARETQLAELTTWASATQDGLGQTRARLIADWRGMEEAVAKRQSEVLSALDQYAATLEIRVQEFLKAIDVSAARSGG